MNNKLLYITQVLIIQIILISSCGQDDVKYCTNEIDIDTLCCETLSVSKMIDSVVLIPLETNKRCLLSYPNKLIATNHCLLICDSNEGVDNVFLFDKSGRYKEKIGDIGHGKGEYISVWDVAIDRTGDSTVVADSGGKILIYDSNGKFLFSKNSCCEGSIITQVGKFSSGFVMSTEYMGASHQIHVYDSKLNLISELLPTNDAKSGYPNYELNKMRIDNDVLYYLDYHNSTFYVVDLKSNVGSYQNFKFVGDNMQSLDKISQNNKGLYNALEGFFLENGNVICYVKQDGIKIATLKINPAKKSVDKLVYDDYLPIFMDCYDGYYYSIISQIDLLNIIECKEDDSYITKQIRRAYQLGGYEINEKSNFVVIKMKMSCE